MFKKIKQINNNTDLVARLTDWVERVSIKMKLLDETASEEIELLHRGQHDLNVAVGQLRKQVKKLEEQMKEDNHEISS